VATRFSRPCVKPFVLLGEFLKRVGRSLNQCLKLLAAPWAVSQSSFVRDVYLYVRSIGTWTDFPNILKRNSAGLKKKNDSARRFMHQDSHPAPASAFDTMLKAGATE